MNGTYSEQLDIPKKLSHERDLISLITRTTCQGYTKADCLLKVPKDWVLKGSWALYPYIDRLAAALARYLVISLSSWDTLRVQERLGMYTKLIWKELDLPSHYRRPGKKGELSVFVYI